MAGWQPGPRNPMASVFGVRTPNTVLRMKSFFISYNPGAGHEGETALVHEDD
jgi:hypothetical protein